MSLEWNIVLMAINVLCITVLLYQSCTPEFQKFADARMKMMSCIGIWTNVTAVLIGVLVILTKVLGTR